MPLQVTWLPLVVVVAAASVVTAAATVPGGSTDNAAAAAAGAELARYVLAGDDSGVRAALQAGASPEQHMPPTTGDASTGTSTTGRWGDGSGRLTVLMAAAEAGHAGVVRQLLEAGAAPERQTAGDGMTALMLAAAAGRAEVAQELLLRRRGVGAEVDHPDARGWTALLHAASAGEVSTAQLLLERGGTATARRAAKDGECAFTAAARSGHLHMLPVLLEGGADVNQQTRNGTSALMLAAAAGDVGTVRWLLNRGEAALGLRDAAGRSASDHAERGGHIQRGWLWDGGELAPVFAAASAARRYRTAAAASADSMQPPPGAAGGRPGPAHSAANYQPGTAEPPESSAEL
jgi:hypothetical protein